MQKSASDKEAMEEKFHDLERKYQNRIETVVSDNSKLLEKIDEMKKSMKENERTPSKSVHVPNSAGDSPMTNNNGKSLCK